MQSPLLLLIAAYLLQICCGFLSSITSHWRVGILPLKDTVWPSVDISPEKNGKLIKRVIRKGDFTKGKPTTQDCVTISWQIRSREGKLLHDSDMLPSDEKTFSFTLGQGKSEVIEGWDIAVADMYEGETAAFNISTDLAFGEQGLPPYIEPHSDICCDLTLIQITPSIDRSFKRIAPDEDIQDELMEKLMSGHIPLPSKDNDGIPSAPPDKPPSSARIFDPSKHNLNPKQKVAGEGRGHNWEESFRNIEIEIPLPSSVSGKADLIVRIRSKELYVKLSTTNEVIFSSQLFGGIVTSSAMWAIADDDPTNRFRGKRLIFSLEKAHGYRDIWATALDQQVLADSLNEMQ